MTARRLAVFAVALLFAAPAFAQDEPPPDLPPPAETPPPAAAPAAAPAATDALKKFAKKGVIEIEGGIGFGYYKGGDYAFTLSPAGRYFIINGLSVGLRLDLSYQKFGDGKITSFGFVPMAEYNLDLGSRLFPYGGLGIGYGYSKFSTAGLPSSGQSSGIFDLSAGVKMVFGHGGVLGLGIDFPIDMYDGGTSWAFQIVTRYGVFF